MNLTSVNCHVILVAFASLCSWTTMAQNPVVGKWILIGKASNPYSMGEHFIDSTTLSPETTILFNEDATYITSGGKLSLPMRGIPFNIVGSWLMVDSILYLKPNSIDGIPQEHWEIFTNEPILSVDHPKFRNQVVILTGDSLVTKKYMECGYDIYHYIKLPNR